MGQDGVDVTPYPKSLLQEEESVERMMTVLTIRRQESNKWWRMFNEKNVECPVPHDEKPKEGARRPVCPVNHDLSNTQVEIEEDAKRPVNQVDQPFKSARSPGCLDKQVHPSVNEHHCTEAPEGMAPRRAQEEWVVVLPRRKTKVPKKSDKAQHRPAVDNTRRKKYINHEQRRSREEEDEAEFGADLDEAFLLEYPFLQYMMTGQTTGCLDGTPAPKKGFASTGKEDIKEECQGPTSSSCASINNPQVERIKVQTTRGKQHEKSRQNVP